ncbi:hypothetical protein AK812_SmicGene47111, partial [Symbiodinium microadriaticum]
VIVESRPSKELSKQVEEEVISWLCPGASWWSPGGILVLRGLLASILAVS